MLFARSAAERDKWVLESGGTGPKALSHFHSAPFEREYVLGVKLAQGNFGAVHEVRHLPTCLLPQLCLLPRAQMTQS